MSLTRKMLKAMGIEDDAADEIINAHAETVSSLKKQAEEAQANSGNAEALQKEVEELRQQLEAAGTDEYKAKYEEEHKAFENFKTGVEQAKTEREKKAAYRKLLETAGVGAKQLDAVLRATDLSSVEMEDGKLKDEDKLTEAIKSDWAAFIPSTGTQGTDPATPPNNGNDAGFDMSTATAAEYLAHKHAKN